MPPKRRQFDVDHWIELYESGMTYDKVARHVGVSTMTVYKRIHEAGHVGRDRAISRRKSHRARRDTYSAELVERYCRGESVLSLSRAYGIQRSGVHLALADHGITPRSRGETNVIRFRNAAQRAAIARNAHFAFGKGESELYELLAKRGYVFDRQVISGPYNIDLALPEQRLAVEVYASNPLRPCSREHRRGKDLLDTGWDIIYVWFGPRCAIRDGAANEIVTWLQSRRYGPATPRQYRVIRGCGKTIAAGSGHLDELTFKRTPHRCFNNAA